MTISENELAWIKEQDSPKTGITEEMVTAWYTEVVDGFKEIGLEKTLEGGVDGEMFTEMVRGAVVGKIQSNISVEPTTFKLMLFGPYPEKNIKNKRSVEIIALGSTEGGDVKLTSLLGSKGFEVIKNNVEALGSYETGVSYNKDNPNNDPANFKVYVQAATKFSEDTKTAFVAETYKEKMDILHKMIPKVELGSIEHGVSRLNKSKNDKTFPDSLDLRRVLARIQGTDDGVDKTGRSWAMYHIVDGSFKPTIERPHIAVWVDPSIYDRLQAGEGSFLEIYGTIVKNQDGSHSMSACFVDPVKVVPMERRADQAQTDQPGGSVQAPSQVNPQIQVMSSIGQFGM